ncbi:PTGDS isomerase, partial [Amia calva]|nr:PTGDS isomerase [Amia calva]
MPYRDKLRVAMGILRPMDNGDVNVTMWSLRSPGCYSQVYVYEKMAVPGLFSYFSTRHNRVKDITIVETNYNEYALVLKHKNRLDKDFTQVALYGRPELVEKFRQFALSRGFSKESIVIPPAEGEGHTRDPHTAPSNRRCINMMHYVLFSLSDMIYIFFK